MLTQEALLKFDLESSLIDNIDNAAFKKLLMILRKINETHQFLITLPSYPQVADSIYREELIKAVGGTQSIEGNNLSAEEISRVFDRADADHSLLVAEQEILNSRKAYEFIIDYVTDNIEQPFTESVIKQIHSILTNSLPYQYNKPGEYRNVPVQFGIPPLNSILLTESDVRNAMPLFVRWLNNKDDNIISTYPLMKAFLSHYYFTEIHPFGDGNGRTARALESMIIYRNGKFNRYCFWSLANFFALNRDQYLRELRKIRETLNVLDYLEFSAKGYLTELERIQSRALSKVKKLMLMDYVQYLHRTKSSQQTKINQRIVAFMELICTKGEETFNEFISDPIFLGLYSKVSPSTFKRDFKKMHDLGLIVLTVATNDQTTIHPNWTLLEKLNYK